MYEKIAIPNIQAKLTPGKCFRVAYTGVQKFVDKKSLMILESSLVQFSSKVVCLEASYKSKLH